MLFIGMADRRLLGAIRSRGPNEMEAYSIRTCTGKIYLMAKLFDANKNPFDR